MKIVKPTMLDIKQLTELGKVTYMQSHGHCASIEDVEHYSNIHYTEKAFEKVLLDPNNTTYLLYHEDKLVGYSTLVLHCPNPLIKSEKVAKLDRIYLLESAHGLGLGKALLDFNIEYARRHHQTGIWLYTWIENHRAVRFYEKLGFKIIGRHDFKISDRHSNPNHQMYLSFD